jgi:integrase
MLVPTYKAASVKFTVRSAVIYSMIESVNLLNLDQMADILQIKPYTVTMMAHTNQIPHTCVQDVTTGFILLRFDPAIITAWLQSGATGFSTATLKTNYQTQFPTVMQKIKDIDSHYTATKPPKGYSLSKVTNKQIGFVYYVRYIENGKLIPSRWSTHTNDLDAANRFALENRERLLAEYHKRKQKEQDPHAVLPKYYEENSPYMDVDAKRGRTLCAKKRANLHNFMLKVFLPHLAEERIHQFDQIKPATITRLQNKLLLKGTKPQTINGNLSGVKVAFDQLMINGIIEENVFDRVRSLSVGTKDVTERGCLETKAPKGVFDEMWDDRLSYLLCLLIYATNMRNSEIERIQVKDLIHIADVAFIDIPASKSKNGVRIVPLHPFVHQHIMSYIADTTKQPDDYLFSDNGKPIHGATYRKATLTLGEKLKLTSDTLAAQHITFYSGRHFWKTLMNANDLGTVEEVFMGHRVSQDTAKRYNHRDKQGKENLVTKAKEVFAVLSQKLFSRTAASPPPDPQSE